MKKRFSMTVLVVLFVTSVLLSVNILTIQKPGDTMSLSGCVDKATLVLEPHGSHVEQSLYIRYADCAQYPTGTHLEVVHRFELPKGSVVNDMWLWFGDSVMQAQLIDTWTGREIYEGNNESSKKPAYFTQKGNQFELHVFPLSAGAFRKLKINFISPTTWLGQIASIDLPTKMIQSGKNTTKSLHILFREKENIWGIPHITEMPNLNYKILPDSMGYHYMYWEIEDTSPFEQMSLKFNTDFKDGIFTKAVKDSNYCHFQVGISPDDFFDIEVDSSSKQTLVALDISGHYNRDIETLFPKVENILKAATKNNDFLNVMAVAEGQYKLFSNEWLPASDNAVTAFFNEIKSSPFVQNMTENKIPHLLFPRDGAASCFGFWGILDYCTFEYFASSEEAVENYQKGDVVIIYRPINSSNKITEYRNNMKTFMENGGRLLVFYGAEQSSEALGSYFIDGLKPGQPLGAGDIFRKTDGYVGPYFPESIHHDNVHEIRFTDTNVKIDVTFSNGLPVVISKKFGKGLLVVSGLNSWGSDKSLKMAVNVPQLGLNALSHYNQLDELLSKVENYATQRETDRILLFSNSDQLTTEDTATKNAETFVAQFPTLPVINTVNLLDQPSISLPSITVDNKNYYGSGYFLKQISSKSGGLHFEMQTDNDEFILASLNPATLPRRTSFNITPYVDDGTSTVFDFFEVNPISNDFNKPLFFIGKTDGTENITFDISAKFAGSENPQQRNILIPITSNNDNKDVTRLMVGAENLRKMLLNSPTDTTSIVNMAMQYNLLCDYTAFLVLNPNDSLHFMQNPFDEDGLTLVNDEFVEQDTIEVDCYPNPFNSETTIRINLPELADMNISVFNIKGQLVQELFDQPNQLGLQTVRWHGQNDYGQIVSTGIYFIRVTVASEKERKVFVKRLLFLK